MGSPKEVAISSNVVPELTQALEDWERRYGLQGLWWLEHQRTETRQAETNPEGDGDATAMMRSWLEIKPVSIFFERQIATDLDNVP